MEVGYRENILLPGAVIRAGWGGEGIAFAYPRRLARYRLCGQVFSDSPHMKDRVF